MAQSKIIPGDTVEYTCVSGKIHVKVLKIKPDGKLILDTRSENRLLKPDENGKTTVKLIKNVSVLASRVNKVNL